MKYNSLVCIYLMRPLIIFQVYYGSYKPCIEIKNAVPGKDNVIAVKATFDNINFTKEQELNFNVLYTPTPDVDLRPGRLVITLKDDPNNKGYYEKNNTGIKGFNVRYSVSGVWFEC